MFSLLGLGLVAMAGAAPAPAPTQAPTATAVIDCAVRELAFTFSQALLPQGSAAQDAAVAAALRLESDCGKDMRRLFRTRSPAATTSAAADASATAGTVTTGPTASGPTTATACALYVATTGSDAGGTGTQAAPFASLHRAQSALRTARVRDGL